jgi:hypothetical protein
MLRLLGKRALIGARELSRDQLSPGTTPLSDKKKKKGAISERALPAVVVKFSCKVKW